MNWHEIIHSMTTHGMAATALAPGVFAMCLRVWWDCHKDKKSGHTEQKGDVNEHGG